jgi:hypothetical protein
MKIINSKPLSVLAEKLCTYISIDELLTDHGIPCIAQCHAEVYDGDCRRMFEFGHKYWKKTIIAFYDNEFNYFAIGSKKQIQKILMQEIKEIEAEA